MRVSSAGISPAVIEARVGDAVWLRFRSVDGLEYVLFEPVYDLSARVRPD